MKDAIITIAIFVVIGVMCMCIGYIDGYNNGIALSMRDCQVTYENDMVTIAFDKWEFLHYVGE